MSCSASRAASSSWWAAASCSRGHPTRCRATRACARSIWERRMLELHDVRAGYGEAVVLEGISASLAEGGRLALLGRNGVGKSTLLLTLMGYTRLHKGEVRWRGASIARLPPHRR